REGAVMEPLAPRTRLAAADIVIESHLDGAEGRSLAEDVLDGLTRPFKELPPKHFYDARGAQLFDQICELPEYYPTRCERAILSERAEELAALTGAVEPVELQSDFHPEGFGHVALFDPEHEWIEMRLPARREVSAVVRGLDLPVHFDEGEELRTEISAKFTPERVEGDLAAAGLELVDWLTDPEG